MVLTLPAVPGWSTRAHGGADALASALAAAWAEADIAAYARTKGTHHDLVLHDHEVDARKVGRVAYDPDRADRARGSRGRRVPGVLSAVSDYAEPPTAAERDSLTRALAWRWYPDGVGLSPAGRRFNPGSWQARTVRSVLARYGRPAEPVETA